MTHVEIENQVLKGSEEVAKIDSSDESDANKVWQTEDVDRAKATKEAAEVNLYSSIDLYMVPLKLTG